MMVSQKRHTVKSEEISSRLPCLWGSALNQPLHEMIETDSTFLGWSPFNNPTNYNLLNRGFSFEEKETVCTLNEFPTV